MTDIIESLKERIKLLENKEVLSQMELGEVLALKKFLAYAENVEKCIDELNKKYPSQCYGSIGVKWNEELKAKIKELSEVKQ